MQESSCNSNLRTSPRANDECSDSPYGQCSFYAYCLEARYHCGPNGYPIGYGLKYCEKFKGAQLDKPFFWVQVSHMPIFTVVSPFYPNNHFRAFSFNNYYLLTECIECMVNSNKVIRAGVTPELRDIPNLVSNLTYIPTLSSIQTRRRTQTETFFLYFSFPVLLFDVI
jgi:Phosphomannose isomerase type I